MAFRRRAGQDRRAVPPGSLIAVGVLCVVSGAAAYGLGDVLAGAANLIYGFLLAVLGLVLVVMGVVGHLRRRLRRRR